MRIKRFGQVKITNPSKTSFWYANLINSLFWVEPYDERSYQVADDTNWHGFIRKTDCEVIFSDIGAVNISLYT